MSVLGHKSTLRTMYFRLSWVALGTRQRTKIFDSDTETAASVLLCSHARKPIP